MHSKLKSQKDFFEYGGIYHLIAVRKWKRIWKKPVKKKLEISTLNLGQTSKTLKQQRKRERKIMAFTKKSLNSNTVLQRHKSYISSVYLYNFGSPLNWITVLPELKRKNCCLCFLPWNYYWTCAYSYVLKEYSVYTAIFSPLSCD